MLQPLVGMYIAPSVLPDGQCGFRLLLMVQAPSCVAFLPAAALIGLGSSHPDACMLADMIMVSTFLVILASAPELVLGRAGLRHVLRPRPWIGQSR